MSSQISFSGWLKQRRAVLGLTQYALAHQINCSLSLLRKIEGGARRPSQQVAERLADVLKIPTGQRNLFINLALLGNVASITSPPEPPTLPEPYPGRLPAQPTTLIGRDRELMMIGEQVLTASGRLVTLVGPPGVGKTHLAIQAAKELAPVLDDGVCFVALAPLREHGLVPAAVAQALGVRELAGVALHQAIAELLRGRRALLVLDNCEHVLPAATFVARLLQHCPQLRVLATSREPLRVRAEQRFMVTPLMLPSTDRPDVLTVAHAPATALFVERAHAVAPAFKLDDSNASAVAAICARVDGLPLAIELAAGRSDELSPNQLLAQLDRRLPTLTNGPRDLPTHQQTLRGAIGWSYDLLNDAERALFAGLAVFAGGCEIEAAEAVCVMSKERRAGNEERRTENGERRTENRERRTENEEQRTGNEGRGAKDEEQGTRNREQGTRNRERRAENEGQRIQLW